MSFKSVMKGIGKVALKVAPYAAMAIPGVGIPLGMAISGATSAASKKLEGGSWKDALISGGIGAGTAAIGGGALKGIGPSSSVLSKIGAGAAGKTAGTGVAGKVGGILGSMATNAAGSKLPKGVIDESGAMGGGNNRSWSGALDSAVSAIPGAIAGSRSNPNPNSSTGPLAASSQAVPRQSGNAPGFSYGTNNPNLADSILAGQQNALKNQPFRRGYDITQTNYNPTPLTTPNTKTIIGHMPKIYSDFDPRTMARKQRQQQAAQ